LAYTAAGTYASRPPPTPEEIERALANIAPPASSVPVVEGAPQGHHNWDYIKIPPQEDWGWTKAALDVAGGAVVMTGVVCFGVGVYYVACDIFPKLSTWLSSL
jgi:hypothetical protein